MAGVTMTLSVDLSEIDDFDFRQEMNRRGLDAPMYPEPEAEEIANVLEQEDLDEIETLAICGQIEPARALALKLVGELIGRTL
jgi:hypothetical protein